MRAEAKPGIRGGIRLGIAGQLNIRFDIPQGPKVTVTNWADTARQLIQKTGLGRRLLHDTNAVTQQVIEHVC